MYRSGRFVLSFLAFLALAILVACGGSSSSSNNGGNNGGSNPGGSNPGNSGGEGSAAAAPSTTTFLYGTAGETLFGARFSAGQLTLLTLPHDPVTGDDGWMPGTGGLISSIATDPRGRFVYALSIQTASFGNPIGKNGLSAFRVDRNTGNLTTVEGSPYNVVDRGGQIAVTGDGQKLVLVSNAKMYVYSIDQTSGALTLLKTTPSLSDRLQTSWDGQYAYVGAVNGPLASYKIAADGTATEVSRIDVQNRGRLFLSYSGKYLYSSGNDGVTVVSIGAGGQLSIAQNNFAGFQIAATTRDDRFAYLATGGTIAGKLQAFTVDPSTGAIGNPIGAAVNYQTSDFPYDMKVDYAGKYVLISNAGSPFKIYPINSDGSLGSPSSAQFNAQEFELLP